MGKKKSNRKSGNSPSLSNSGTASTNGLSHSNGHSNGTSSSLKNSRSNGNDANGQQSERVISKWILRFKWHEGFNQAPNPSPVRAALKDYFEKYKPFITDFFSVEPTRVAKISFSDNTLVEYLRKLGTLSILGKEVRIIGYNNEKEREARLDECYATSSVEMKVTRNKIELSSSSSDTSGFSTEKVEIGDTLKWGVHVRSLKNPKLKLVELGIHPSDVGFTFVDSSVIQALKNNSTKQNGLTLPLEVIVNFKSEDAGIHRAWLSFKFSDRSISRKVFVVEAIDSSLTVGNEKQVPRSLTDDGIIRQIIPAPELTPASSSHRHTPLEHSYVRSIGDWPIPESIQENINGRSTHGLFNPYYTKENYKARFHNLLYIEEAQQVKDIRKYDMAFRTFQQTPPIWNNQSKTLASYLRLNVPNLAEKRPSVLQNDSLYAWIAGTKDVEYEGKVAKVERDHILLLFCPQFHKMIIEKPKTQFHVRFGFSRREFRTRHDAIDNVNLDLVFPETSLYEKRDAPIDISWIPEQIINTISKQCHDRQRQAILKIVNRKPGSVPFLLYGPFGAGKTFTISETIKMILQISAWKNVSTPILVCTLTNSAANIILKSLSSVCRPSEMLRLFAFRRNFFGVESEVLKFCKFEDVDGETFFTLPTLQELLKYKVIICTCAQSYQLYSVGIGKNHFSYIFLDEAAQLMEPDAVIPLVMASSKTLVVMSGDVKQLGPIVFSTEGKKHKLNKSMMERFSESFKLLYQPDTNPDEKTGPNFEELYVIYRCPKEIIEYCSAQFYNRHLVSRAKVQPLNSWKRLKNPSFPMLFVGVEGKDERSEDNPSWFNRAEASAVRKICEQLVTSHVNPNDIRVISPYFRQIQLLRETLRIVELRSISVGSVEDFQGNEKPIIILSTVRSTPKYLQLDKNFDIGFLCNPKRFNTAITRTQQFLVVVGCPYGLYQSPHFRAFMEFAKENNAYEGPALDENDIDFWVKERDASAPETTVDDIELRNDQHFLHPPSVAAPILKVISAPKQVPPTPSTPIPTPATLSSTSQPVTPIISPTPGSTTNHIPVRGPTPTSSSPTPTSPALNPARVITLPAPEVALPPLQKTVAPTPVQPEPVTNQVPVVVKPILPSQPQVLVGQHPSTPIPVPVQPLPGAVCLYKLLTGEEILTLFGPPPLWQVRDSEGSTRIDINTFQSKVEVSQSTESQMSILITSHQSPQVRSGLVVKIPESYYDPLHSRASLHFGTGISIELIKRAVFNPPNR